MGGVFRKPLPYPYPTPTFENPNLKFWKPLPCLVLLLRSWNYTIVLSLNRLFPSQVLFDRPKQVIFWCTKIPSIIICYHHWSLAHMDWDIASSKPHIFMTASPILWELSPLSCHELLYTIQNWCLCVCVIPFPGQQGRGAERTSIRTCQTGSVGILLSWY